MPRRIPKKDIIIVLILFILSLNKLIDSGIRSVIDTQIITPAAKDKEDKTILLVSFFLIKIKIVPSIVDKPANTVSKKA